eukprot:GHVU01169898.1.p2 GENE.GHVU01169898.1~~GHVU01169898.1.p2  ORF type:complete len:128 (+),score=10.69 GHVU01169898.1:1678-2061(+)
MSVCLCVCLSVCLCVCVSVCLWQTHASTDTYAHTRMQLHTSVRSRSKRSKSCPAYMSDSASINQGTAVVRSTERIDSDPSAGLTVLVFFYICIITDPPQAHLPRGAAALGPPRIHHGNIEQKGSSGL